MTFTDPAPIFGPVSLLITDDCINCGACEECCPTAAISEDVEHSLRIIDSKRCVECVGFYNRTMCQVECPVECCLPNLDYQETEEQLLEKAKGLFPEVEFPDPPASHLK